MARLHSRGVRARGVVLTGLVVLLLAGLPAAVWLDLRDLSESALHRQASNLNSVISSIRGYYGTKIVERVLAHHGATQVLPNYEEVPGAIPIPATLSIELGRVIGEQQSNIVYRFVSDYPFKNRAVHPLDEFEKNSLIALRQNPNQEPIDVSWSLFENRVRHITPILMGASCVSCHNTHPDSPKRDWKVGDVRGIQEVTITQPIAANIFSFKYLLTYFVLAAGAGMTLIILQGRQAAAMSSMNRELESTNEFLAAVSMKISRYLAPQVYKSIFTGQRDVTIHTERKRLTIFFSDIKDFTATTERLQPEEMTARLNEYFTEMAMIAGKHGGTVDKFIGDAMLIFFGDPETRGAAEDAKACLRMAVDMQRRLAELNARWRKEGIEHPFRVRMGINSGFCNVGNFGSNDRMDYTIIGAEANLAARLQSIAEPGQIVMSYETYALVRDIVVARALPPISMKGISRPVVPYAVEGMLDANGAAQRIFSEHMTGLDFYLDPGAVDDATAAHIRTLLQSALATLERRAADAARPEPGTAPL
jgi:class 3 adenylate cyclase